MFQPTSLGYQQSRTKQRILNETHEMPSTWRDRGESNEKSLKLTSWGWNHLTYNAWGSTCHRRELYKLPWKNSLKLVHKKSGERNKKEGIDGFCSHAKSQRRKREKGAIACFWGFKQQKKIHFALPTRERERECSL